MMPYFRPLPLMTVFALAALLILVTLGNWQMRRLEWKEALIAQVDERVNLAPIPLDTALEQGSLAEINYTPVTVAGQFDHSREVHVFGRSLEGYAGYYVYTPLTRENAPFVIVNRGFVPQDLKAAETRLEGQVEGRVTITGLLRVPSPGNSFQPENDIGENQWYVADLEAMVTQMNADWAVPVFVDAGPYPNPGGWPMGGETRITFRNDHLGYALTWYGLAMTLLGVYIAVHVKAGRLTFRRSTK